MEEQEEEKEREEEEEKGKIKKNKKNPTGTMVAGLTGLMWRWKCCNLE